MTRWSCCRPVEPPGHVGKDSGLADASEGFGLDAVRELYLEIAGAASVVKVDVIVIAFPYRTEPNVTRPLYGELQATLAAAS